MLLIDIMVICFLGFAFLLTVFLVVFNDCVVQH